jgi:sodium-dependent phosphate cotransporter
VEVERETDPTEIKHNDVLWRNLRYVLYICVTLLFFILGIEIIVSSLHSAGEESINAILRATSNSFTAFFIGVVVTAMMQSSSTTTAITVALVASNTIQIHSGVCIVMGANLGTTITSMIVSIGFINEKKEFRRAVSASGYHFFFNLFTILILFPLELSNQFFSRLSTNIANYFFSNPSFSSTGQQKVKVWSLLNPVNDFLTGISPVFGIMLGLIIIFSSIILFRRIISSLLKAQSPQAFSRFFFKSRVKSFVWGIITTAAIRSSTITTSVVVPIVSKRITSLKQASPFILGANLGTTITAFFAASLNQANGNVMSIAMAHFLFNLIGVILFFPFASVEKIILFSAKSFAKVSASHKFVLLTFILCMFFFFPFLIIYLAQ